MIKAYTAYTSEIDEVDVAVSEVLERLQLPEELLKNNVGILTCYSEFVDTGVVKALCRELPFDVIGTTTTGNAVPGAVGSMNLNLIVLSSDDISFSTCLTASVSDEQEEAIALAYQNACQALPGKPSLVISFLPLLYHVGGDRYVDVINRVSGGVPMFGTLSVDHTQDYHTCYVIHNGECVKDALALLLLSGSMEPFFHIASISEEKILKQKAIITASQGNVLQEVNNTPIIQYMQSLGLSRNGRIDGASSIPFIVDYNDGTPPVARAIFATTPEGYAVCGGAMPVNSTLAVGAIDYDDVITTTTQAIRLILTETKPQVVLMFSCISRLMALGVDSLAEMNQIKDELEGKVPFLFTYSGGEVCPVHDDTGNTITRFHNDTFTVCVLQ